MFLPYICLKQRILFVMKKFVSAITVLVLLCSLQACKKTQSTDAPLPVVRKEAVYISTENNNLISYQYNTGEKLWEVILKGNAQSTPVLYNKKLYTITGNGYLYSIDILKGEIYREMNIGLSSVHALSAVNGKLYIASDKLYCYDTTMNFAWWYIPASGDICTTAPQVINNRVFVGAGNTCHAVDAGTGLGVWVSAPLPDSIKSSPSVSNGVVYFGCNDKKVYALNESDGSPRWNFATMDKVFASPIVYGGMCLIGGMDYDFYCIDTTTGFKRWSTATAERISSSAAIHELTNTVLFGSYDFNLYALSHVDGKIKWKYPAGSLIKSSPVVYKDYVYFTSFDRYIYCVNVNSGNLVWKQFLNGNTLSSPVVDDLQKGVHPSVSGMSKY